LINTCLWQIIFEKSKPITRLSNIDCEWKSFSTKRTDIEGRMKCGYGRTTTFGRSSATVSVQITNYAIKFVLCSNGPATARNIVLWSGGVLETNFYINTVFENMNRYGGFTALKRLQISGISNSIAIFSSSSRCKFFATMTFLLIFSFNQHRGFFRTNVSLPPEIGDTSQCWNKRAMYCFDSLSNYALLETASKPLCKKSLMNIILVMRCDRVVQRLCFKWLTYASGSPFLELLNGREFHPRIHRAFVTE